MNHYPVFLDLTGRKVLLIGETTAKLPALRDAGAEVVHVHDSDFRPGLLDGVHLVICLAADERLNAEVSALASARGIFCNVIDRPPLCSFIAPAIVKRGHIQIAISTGGRSPALAVRLKEEIASQIGEEYGELLDLLAEARDAVRSRHSTPEARAKVFHAMVRGPALDLLRAGRREEARETLQEQRLLF